jgi:hypothetical protein
MRFQSTSDSLRWEAVGVLAAAILITCFGPDGRITSGMLGEEMLFIVIVVGVASAVLFIMTALERALTADRGDEQDELRSSVDITALWPLNDGHGHADRTPSSASQRRYDEETKRA